MKNKMIFLVSFALSLGVITLTAAAKEKGKNGDGTSVKKITTNDIIKTIDINDIEYYFSSNGQGATDPAHSKSQGFYYPKGTPKSAIYQDGFVWAGYLNLPDGTTDLRSGGGTYVGGQQAGKILTSGVNNAGVYTAPTAGAASDAKYKIYKIRKDWQTEPDATLKAALQSDYENWPWQDGAPVMKNAAGTADSIDANGFHVPKWIGDEMLWYVSNDLDAGRSVALYGRNPMGIEVQTLVFGFKQSPFNSMIFVKRKIINKSGLTISDMYVSQWSDPDLGGAGDDVVGCDPSLKLGYCYNGDDNDATYGSAIPAVGYVFFQGPLVNGDPGDIGTSYENTYPGKKNLPLSSFAFYINGGPANLGDPALGNADGTQQLYWYQTGNDFFGRPFANVFPFSGDPVRGKGSLDGRNYSPDDRRLMLSSGPFTMAPGDSQEIVTSTIVGLGDNYLKSVSVLKSLAAEAQEAYSLNFDLPTPPNAPVVKATSLSEKVILDWSDTANLAVEKHVDGEYMFEGYMVYQMPNATENNVEKGFNIGSFDLNNSISIIKAKVFDDATGSFVVKPTREFSNSGIIRSLAIDYDYINNRPLINNREYYYKVTAISAYNPNPDAAINLGIKSYLENATATIKVIPQEYPGERVNSTLGEMLTYTHPTGAGQGLVFARVANPKEVTGADYQVIFQEDTQVGSPTEGKLLWNLKNMTTGQLVYPKNRVQVADGSGLQFEDIVEGLQVVATGPSLEFTDFLTTSNAGGPIDPPEFGGMDPNHQGFPRNLANTVDQNIARQQVATGAGLGWGIHTNPTGSSAGAVNYDYFISRTTRNGNNWSHIVPYDFELRFTATGGKAVNWFSNGNVIDVPFEIWNVGIGTPNDPSDDYRLIPWLNNAQGDPDVFDIGGDHPYSGGANDPYSDWIYWMAPVDKTPGHAGYDADIADAVADPVNYAGDKVDYEIMARVVVTCWNGGTAAPYARPLPEPGTTFRIVSSKPNATNDVYAFSTKGVTSSAALAKDDVQKINVFPNPYFGSSALEPSRFNRQVSFTHLPAKATIRIFTLSGTHVATINHDNGTQYDTWNLFNSNNLPVASGMYVIYIDTPSGTKTLKLAVIQETQYLENI